MIDRLISKIESLNSIVVDWIHVGICSRAYLRTVIPRKGETLKSRRSSNITMGLLMLHTI